MPLADILAAIAGSPLALRGLELAAQAIGQGAPLATTTELLSMAAEAVLLAHPDLDVDQATLRAMLAALAQAKRGHHVGIIRLDPSLN